MRARRAFTFPEVLLSLFVLAVSMSLLISLQTQSIFRIFKTREDVDRIYVLKDHTYRLMLNPTSKKAQSENPPVEHIDLPDMAVTDRIAPISKKSVLANLKDYLVVVSSEGKWKSGSNERFLKMVSFVYKEKKKNREEGS